MIRKPLSILILATMAGIPLSAQSAGNEHWVATWATSPPLARVQPPPSAPTNPNPTPQQILNARGFTGQTVRMIVRTSIGGHRLRVKFANAFGAPTVEIGAAHIAIRDKDSQIVAGSDRPLLFNGKPNCTLGPGVALVSDPVDLTFAPLATLAVSVYFPVETGPPNAHGTGLHTTYISNGDSTAQPAIANPLLTTASYYWLSSIDVAAPAKAAAIVAFGDSITDGAQSTVNTDHSWPALLAARLAKNRKTADIGVSNQGIGGNRVLRDITGVSALGRFDRDVLAQSGVKWLMLLEGINDIGHGAVDPTEMVTTEDIIGGYKQIIDAAHDHGIKVIGCTLTPYEGASYSRPEGEAIREAVNNWIRTSHAFDAVVDFEAATRDPANPKRIRTEFDPGDHLHPNNAGYEAMANAVDLTIFTRK
jgi:lysophospholipase L1-like esterase